MRCHHQLPGSPTRLATRAFAGLLAFVALERAQAADAIGAHSAPPGRDRALVAHWRLEADCRDSSGNGNHGVNHGVEFMADGRKGKATSAARFAGGRQFIEIPASDSLDLGRGDFTISLWLHTERLVDDVFGDLVSNYDPVTRRGFHLSFLHHAGACTSTANTRNLFFGIDGGTEPKWTDCERPGNNLLPYALAVWRGGLYAGTWEPDEGQAGRVYRYAGDTNWVDCGSPDPCNAVGALAVFEDQIYAAVSRYSGTGSHLRPSPNQHLGGKVYRYGGGKKWLDCGRVSDAEYIFGLAVFGGTLYATAMDAPPKPDRQPRQGLHRYDGGTNWTYCGHPGGRVAALAVFNGGLYGTGYNGGALGGVFRYEGGTDWSNWGAPPNVDQTYSFAAYQGALHVGTWKEGKVFRYDGPNAFTSLGRLGEELEVMGMAVFNGKLYAGTLPLAQVYRHDGGTNWTLTGRLDFSEVEYRRAWSMAVYQGRLFCGVLPSGHVHALEAGRAVTHDHELSPGWHHVAAMRAGSRLKLFVDGRLVATSVEFDPDDFDLSTAEPLRIGFGASDYFHGSLRDLRIYRRALRVEEVSILRQSRRLEP
ncbi:MAG: LamG domain-containing protein [Verrucomicrobia bacterium]|nr:LamG domain-containing protein [Verrucomicrobiota bacterium]